MPSRQNPIEYNLQAIQGRIAAAVRRAERDPETVRLVAVTKAVGLAEVSALRDLGVQHFAENRIDAARPKIEALRGEELTWHMIGNIQRRKALDVVELFDRADAVDRLSLARTLQDRCEAADRTLPCLVEVNVSGEAAKHGLSPEELPAALRELRTLDRLRVEGLLTMAPYGAEEAVLRHVFRTLSTLAHDHGLPELSMGMTDDFETAIEEGATQVRIGRALYV